jgi:hypothetical protein
MATKCCFPRNTVIRQEVILLPLLLLRNDNKENIMAMKSVPFDFPWVRKSEDAKPKTIRIPDVSRC